MKCDLISERIFMPTLFFLEEPPCSLESVSVCPRRSLPWLLPPSRSRLWLLLSASTLSGLEDLFLLLCPPSKVCGSARKNMTNPDHRSSTASASKEDVSTFVLDTLLWIMHRLTFIVIL